MVTQTSYDSNGYWYHSTVVAVVCIQLHLILIFLARSIATVGRSHIWTTYFPLIDDTDPHSIAYHMVNHTISHVAVHHWRRIYHTGPSGREIIVHEKSTWHLAPHPLGPKPYVYAAMPWWMYLQLIQSWSHSPHMTSVPLPVVSPSCFETIATIIRVDVVQMTNSSFVPSYAVWKLVTLSSLHLKWFLLPPHHHPYPGMVVVVSYRPSW